MTYMHPQTFEKHDQCEAKIQLERHYQVLEGKLTMVFLTKEAVQEEAYLIEDYGVRIGLQPHPWEV